MTDTTTALRNMLAMVSNVLTDSQLDHAHCGETIRSALEPARAAIADAEKRDAGYAALQAIGQSAAESIAELVAALECDYSRLEELREERDDWSEDEDLPEPRAKHWSTAYPDEAEELAELETAAGDCESREDAEQRIAEHPLSVEYRSGWANVGDTMPAEEFRILLGTGGPATRIIGELNGGEPTRARIQAQDWFTVWTDYTGDAVSQEDLLTYCRCFYFGD